MAVVQVCVAALRHQNADCDAEVAHVLQRHAGDRLDIEIEQLDALIRRMERAAEARAGARGAGRTDAAGGRTG